MFRGKDAGAGGDVEMFGRGFGEDSPSEDDNEHNVLLSGENASWLRRGGSRGQYAPPSTSTKVRQGAHKRMMFGQKGCTLKSVLQAVGLRRREVCYLPREIPLDGTLSAAAARGAGRADEGLVAALQIPNIVRNQKYRATTFVSQAHKRTHTHTHIRTLARLTCRLLSHAGGSCLFRPPLDSVRV